MNRILLSALCLFCGPVFSQLPPPGLSPVVMADIDNDGHELFDLEYYTYMIRIPDLENITGQSLAGYTVTFESDGVPVPGQYVNEVMPQQIDFVWTYNGNGPVYVPYAPYYLPLSFFGGCNLQLVPWDGDEDNDSVLNIDEDPNGNGILNDDWSGGSSWDYLSPDDDGDGILTIDEDYNNNGTPMDDDVNGNGIPDFRDGEQLGLGTPSQTDFQIYPNPTHGMVTISISNPDADTAIIVYDLNGRIIREINNLNENIEISGLSTGMYLVRIKSNKSESTKKLIVF